MKLAFSTMNYYEILGVKNSASTEEIRKKYRELARENHPDMHPGDSKKEEKFKEVTQAYTTLSDKVSREKYDLELSYKNERNYPRSESNDFFTQDIFKDLFKNKYETGLSLKKKIKISLRDLYVGKEITLKIEGKEQKLKIDPHIEDSQTFILRGGGQLGRDGWGDLYLTIDLQPDPIYLKSGLDLYIEKNIDLKDILIGKTISFTHLDGRVVKVKVKPAKKLNTTLKVKELGLKSNFQVGNLYIKLNVILPLITAKQKTILENEF